MVLQSLVLHCTEGQGQKMTYFTCGSVLTKTADPAAIPSPVTDTAGEPRYITDISVLSLSLCKRRERDANINITFQRGLETHG